MFDKLPAFSATGTTLPAPDSACDGVQLRYFLSPGPQLNPPATDGSLRGVGEKVETNPANGTCSLTIPIELTAGRNGFAPNIALTYDTSAGNGCFGLGWSLSTEKVSRLTSWGVPRYFDSYDDSSIADEVVFVLTGFENLVPVAETSSPSPPFPGYHVRTYQPRIESAFYCIEKWIKVRHTSDLYWRVVSPVNVTSI